MKKTLLAILAVSSLWAANVDSTLNALEKSQADSRDSQKRIDAYSDETARLYEEYRSILERAGQVRAYNAQMERLIASQQGELDSLDRQIGEIGQTGKALVPLMTRMIDGLDRFLAADAPFLYNERSQRISDLREMMDDASVTLAEKYRKIMEAYSTENEYARTIEAYRGVLEDGRERTVDFLRIGRVGLYYRTIDGKEVGMWNKSQKGWAKLDDGYKNAVKQGLMVARKQAAPDLLTLPVIKEGGSK